MKRLDTNPLISPSDVRPTRDDLYVMCAFNPGAIRVNGETLLLVRIAEAPVPQEGCVSYAALDTTQDPPTVKVHHIRKDDPDLDTSDPRVFSYRGQAVLSSISHLRLARSRDGESFTLDPKPTVMPCMPYEEYGIEDPRITLLDGRYWINYSAISRQGVVTALMSTTDFVAYERHGIMFAPNNKDIAIFPRKIDGRYLCRHRPHPAGIGELSVWTASSDDLLNWGGHTWSMGPRKDRWDSERVGCGAPPIETDQGWLELYHGSDHNIRYCVGAMLSDLDDPARVLARCDEPVLSPGADYEMTGLMPGVCFHNGLVVDDDTVTVYYGAADTVVCGARCKLDELLAALRPV